MPPAPPITIMLPQLTGFMCAIVLAIATLSATLCIVDFVSAMCGIQLVCGQQGPARVHCGAHTHSSVRGLGQLSQGSYAEARWFKFVANSGMAYLFRLGNPSFVDDANFISDAKGSARRAAQSKAAREKSALDSTTTLPVPADHQQQEEQKKRKGVGRRISVALRRSLLGKWQQPRAVCR